MVDRQIIYFICVSIAYIYHSLWYFIIFDHFQALLKNHGMTQKRLTFIPVLKLPSRACTTYFPAPKSASQLFCLGFFKPIVWSLFWQPLFGKLFFVWIEVANVLFVLNSFWNFCSFFNWKLKVAQALFFFTHGLVTTYIVQYVPTTAKWNDFGKNNDDATSCTVVYSTVMYSIVQYSTVGTVPL